MKRPIACTNIYKTNLDLRNLLECAKMKLPNRNGTDNPKGATMTAKLDPTVIDQLRKQYGFTNFEQVGNKLNRTSHTVRNWYLSLIHI